MFFQKHSRFDFNLTTAVAQTNEHARGNTELLVNSKQANFCTDITFIRAL